MTAVSSDNLTSFPNSMGVTMTILSLEEGPLKIHGFPKQIMLKGKLEAPLAQEQQETISY